MPQYLLTIPKLIDVHCLASSMDIHPCGGWCVKPNILPFSVESVLHRVQPHFGYGIQVKTTPLYFSVWISSITTESIDYGPAGFVFPYCRIERLWRARWWWVCGRCGLYRDEGQWQYKACAERCISRRSWCYVSYELPAIVVEERSSVKVIDEESSWWLIFVFQT